MNAAGEPRARGGGARQRGDRRAVVVVLFEEVKPVLLSVLLSVGSLAHWVGFAVVSGHRWTNAEDKQEVLTVVWDNTGTEPNSLVIN